MADRIIFHIDMNSYFASVEQQANPHLRGVPVGVCEHTNGIIIAPSVEAKRLGIKTGMPVWEAKKIYSGIALLPVDPPKYRSVTQRFLKIFSDYSALVERYSIDEAFLDLSHLTDWSSVLFFALEIKQRIKREIGEWLTCSIGAGPNKLVAKIASGMDKPDGVVIVPPGEVSGLYQRLKLTDMPGIAGRTARRLNALGIYSIRDLALYPESKLRISFGLIGHHLHEMGNFRGGFAVITPEEETVKSMGHSFTLPRATANQQIIRKLLFKLSEKVAARMRKRDMWGSVVGCHIRYAIPTASGHGRFAGEFRSHRIGELINDGRLIFKEAWKICASFRISSLVRQAGVTIAGLVENVSNEPLFERYRKPLMALEAMDRINSKHGEFTLRRAAIFDAKDFAPDTIGFGRIKEMRFPGSGA